MPERTVCPIGASTTSREEAILALAELRVVVSRLDVGTALSLAGFGNAWVRSGIALGDERMIAAMQAAAPVIALPVRQ